MPKHFHSPNQVSRFRQVARKLFQAGAQSVGLTGSRSKGIKKDGTVFDEDSDTDIAAIFPNGHERETKHFTIVERTMPDGSEIPKGVQVSVLPEEGGDVVGIDMKKKARWLRI